MFSLSIDIHENENKMILLKWCTKKYFFNFYFLIVHISTNKMPDNLRVCIHVDNILPEGAVSQISELGLGFHFMGNYLVIFLNILFYIF